MVLFLKILGGILALGIGLYLGRGGRYRPDYEEIDRALGASGVSHRAKRHFTPLGWLRMGADRPSRVRRMNRGNPSGRFKLAAPESKERKKG